MNERSYFILTRERILKQRDLTELAHHMNDQPRSCLGFRSPAEVFLARFQEGG